MANQAITEKGNFSIGDIVKVHQTVKDGEKEKAQVFEGRVISIRGRGVNKSFIVRRIAIDNIGVERIFLLNSPLISKIEIKKSIPEKRAKLFFLRDKQTQNG